MEIYSAEDPSHTISIDELRELCEPFGGTAALEIEHLDEADAGAYLVGLLIEHKIDRQAFIRACGIELRL